MQRSVAEMAVILMLACCPAGTGGLVDPINWRTMEWLKVRKRVLVRHALVCDARQCLII